MISRPAIMSLYDLRGIQSYVFGSNRLAANLGASWLSKAALDTWLDAAARLHGGKLLWSGGGNAMVHSPSEEAARSTATELSRRLDVEAPGLRLACWHDTWGHGEFEVVNERLQASLQNVKNETLPDKAFGGAGVCERCVETGDPVSFGTRDPEGRSIGDALAARLRATSQAENALRNALGGLAEGLAWSRQIDLLGRTRGDRSQIGVIHFDGNGMGERFQAAASRGLDELIDLSRLVEMAGLEALRKAVAPLIDAKKLEELERDEEHGFKLSVDASGRRVVPFRPIVFGGDDITLVCDGRLAVDLAVRLLEAWRSESSSLPGGAAEACVGVALVDSHYPFYRAYELAEQLCAAGKRWLREKRLEGASAIDWARISGGRADIAAARATPAGAPGQPTARPYLVGDVPGGVSAHRAWTWFRTDLLDRWVAAEGVHTQLKRFGEALWSDLRSPGSGGQEVERLLARWVQLGLDLPPVPAGQTQTNGFISRETPYLDALELLDRVIPSDHSIWK